MSRARGKGKDGKTQLSINVCLSARNNTNNTKNEQQTPHLLQLVHPGLEGNDSVPARVTPFKLGKAAPQRLDLSLGLRAAVQRPLTRLLCIDRSIDIRPERKGKVSDRRGERSGQG